MVAAKLMRTSDIDDIPEPIVLCKRGMMILRHHIIIINSAQNTKQQPTTFLKNKKTKSKDKLLKFSTMYQTPSAAPAPKKK
jgi:hypothetical protein